MPTKNHPKKKIIGILKNHPEGLTLEKLSELTDMSRITATKYVHELMGEGVIYQRKVGIAKLCYLKQKYMQMVREEEVIEKLKERIK